MRRVYGALLVAMLVVCCVCAESGRVCKSRWLAGCMGFLWVNGFSFFHGVASPFHSFVTTNRLHGVWVHADSFLHCVASPFPSFLTTNRIPL